MSLEPREDRPRPSDANSIKAIFFPLFPVPDTQQTLKQYLWNQQTGTQTLSHLGPSSCLGLGIHPVQLLQALAQDVLDIFYQLLYLQGQKSGTKGQLSQS